MLLTPGRGPIFWKIPPSDRESSHWADGGETMGLGRQGDQQGTLYLAWDEIPRSRGHAFYDRLQQILRKAGFDGFAEKLYKPFYSDKGRPSIPPGRYFRMHLVGYSRASTASAALNGAAPIRFPSGIFSSFRPRSLCRIITRSAGHGPACRWRPTRRFSPGFSRCSARMV